VPSNHGIKWHVLTAAHLLNSVPIHDTPNYSLNFHLYNFGKQSVQVSYRITAIKIFKRANRDVRINDLMPNSMSLTDIRVKLNHDNKGDVALCEIEDTDGKTHQFLTEELLEQGTQPTLTNSHLSFTLKDGSVCILHLISNQQQVGGIIIQPSDQTRYHLLGYKLWDPSVGTPLIDVPQRREELKVRDEPTFRIDSDFNFFLDIPAYHGMSGGPIFYTKRARAKGKPNEIHIFGVTNAIGKRGEIRLMTRGAFIRPELFQSIHSVVLPSEPHVEDLLSTPIPHSSSSNMLTPLPLSQSIPK